MEKRLTIMKNKAKCFSLFVMLAMCLLCVQCDLDTAMANSDPPGPGGPIIPHAFNPDEDPVDIPNPDRGFYSHNRLLVPQGNTDNNNPSLNNLTGPVADTAPDTTIPDFTINTRISHISFDLARFSSDGTFKVGSGSVQKGTTQTLNDRALNYIRATFASVRNGQGVAHIRFSYDGEGYTYDDAPNNVQVLGPEPKGLCGASPTTCAGLGCTSSTTWVEHHIKQLKPIFEEYEDVIMAVYAGFFGAWGEMHSSTMATTMSNYVWFFNALLDAVPASRSILTTNAGGYVAWYSATYGGSNALTSANMKDMGTPAAGTSAARFGYYNDSFVNSVSDGGSLSESLTSFNRGDTITWIRNQSNFYGGETNGWDSNPDYTRFPFIAWEGPITRVSYLNKDYDGNVLGTWYTFTYNKSNVEINLSNAHAGGNVNTPMAATFDPMYNGKTGLDYLRDRLGYRLVLREANASEWVKQNGVLKFRGKIQNVGFGNVVNQKQVTVVLQNGNNRYAFPVNLDPRTWLSHHTPTTDQAYWTNIDFDLNVGNIPVGNYDIYLRINDPKEQSISIANPIPANSNKRCIQFANEAHPTGGAIWNAPLGANRIGKTEVRAP